VFRQQSRKGTGTDIAILTDLQRQFKRHGITYGSRIPIILQQIVSSGGDNITVEERRGHCHNIAADLER
jgi:hypothetical protein